MRHLIIIMLSGVLSACASTKTADVIAPASNDVPVESLSSVSQSDGITALSRYLRQYVAKNIGDRARTSRNLIDRSGIEGNARLPSKSLFQSLGYRVRDPFVAMPPELDTRSFQNAENALHSKLIQDLETTWALLDSTRARLTSRGGLETNRQDWEVGVVRRNLLLEGIGYWYQMRNQDKHSQWLISLGEKTNELFDEITLARQNYDVRDLRDQELILLSLRTDASALFQFYSSEQARLYNRIGTRVLPEREGADDIYFEQKLECPLDNDEHQKGNDFLRSYYAQEIDAIESSANTKASIYELGSLARSVAELALNMHATRINRVEQWYLKDKVQAQEERDALIREQLNLKEAGGEFDPAVLDELRNTPLQVSRISSSPNDDERLLQSAIMVLANWVSEKLVSLNQQRLETLLVNQNKIYFDNQSYDWSKTNDETKMLRTLLFEVYDYTLIDYLLGYERISFINQAMLRGCHIDKQINSRVIGFEPQSIDNLADIVESSYTDGFQRAPLYEKLQNYAELVEVFSTLASSEDN